METMSLCFRIAVDQSEDIVIRALRKEFMILRQTSRKWILSKNIVEIYHNEDHDAVLASTSKDDYLYYKSNIDFYPIKESTLAMQMQLANEIKQYFDFLSWKSEIIAEFEPLL